MPYPGQIIGGMYQIVDEIGKGGVGIIYRAYHLNLQKYVVVKKIKDNFVGVLEARAEVDILKSLHHSSLPQVYDFVQMGSEIYTVMDFIDGHDLKYYIDHGYFFEEATLWYWLTQLCEVLEYLHAHGILHLDIKPANIMLSSEGKVYLIDFNISLSGEGDTLNGISQYYAAPEQYRKWQALLYGTTDSDGPLDGKADIYSLGSTFYHLMTGIQPSADVINLIPITNFQLRYSDHLVKIIDKMMRPKKEQRYQNTGKVLDAMKRTQRSKEEKNTLRFVFYGMLVGILILLITIGIIIFRSQNYVGKKDRESVVQQEERLRQLCDAGEYEAAYMEGIQFLNTSSDVLEKMEGAEESFLATLAECCMEMEAYAEVLRYTEELLAINAKSEYYRNAAVASAYMGEYDVAEGYLQKAQSIEGNSENIEQIRAEIEASQGGFEEAVAIYQSLESKKNDASFLRRIAVLSLKASEENTYYAELSISYYEQLVSNQMATYTDRMNLVTACLNCGMNEKALYALQEMTVLYSEKYEVYARLGILRYNIELKKAPARRDFTKTKQDVERAIQLYDSQTHQTTDEQIDDLRQLLETLP